MAAAGAERHVVRLMFQLSLPLEAEGLEHISFEKTNIVLRNIFCIIMIFSSCGNARLLQVHSAILHLSVYDASKNQFVRLLWHEIRFNRILVK